MYCKTTICKAIFLTWLCLSGFIALAQENKGANRTIDSAMALSPDYLPTRFAPLPTAQYFPISYTPIDTTLNYIYAYDPLLLPQNLYQSLGINGQAHKNMVFDMQRPLGFNMITLPYPLYFKKISDLKIYDLATSYTDLNFSYGLLTEFMVKATHAQHIRQVDFVVNIDAASNEGYFIHQGINRLSVNGMVRFETQNQLYGFLLAYAFNHGKFAENGGLEYSPDFTDRDTRDSSITNDLSSFPVMFSNGLSLINTHSGQFTNYVNLKTQKGHYFGTVSYTLDFDYLKSNFTDHDLNNLYYQSRYYLNTDSTNDSIRYYSFANTLQWANYSPTDTVSSQPYFFRIAGGVRHEFVDATSPGYRGNQLALFARTSIRLFKVWDLYGDISYGFSGYTRNDALARVGARFSINPKQRHYLGLEARFNRYSPDYIYSHYEGNNNMWDTTWRKQFLFKASAFWTIFDYRLSFNFFHIGRYVFLNSKYIPEQSEKSAQVIQLELFAPLRTKHFSLDANLALQHSTNKAITVPLFAGKLSALYSTRIFKKRLRFQVGVDLFYNTKYYADGYNPILHQFYSQQYLITGNYLYINAHIALRVKRTSFFLRGGNLIAGLMSFRYITTPGYPMEGRSLELGINWKFYD